VRLEAAEFTPKKPLKVVYGSFSMVI